MPTMSRYAITIKAVKKMTEPRNMLIVSRKPTHPGEVLREEFMPDCGLTVSQLARRLSISRQSANELVRCRRSVSSDMALRLSRLFGTSPEYWLNLQRNVDLWDSLDLHRDDIKRIEPLSWCSAG